MRLIEVVEGDETSPEAVQGAVNFAQAIRKTPIRCGECPGFVVNRILQSAIAEVWRYQDDTGVDVRDIDAFVTERKLAPMGPFYLCDMTGLDTTLKVAADLHEYYGDRFYLHQGMVDLVERGDFGRKTGKGFYEHGR
jgi:3-hydroxyacyl-CoA dehydrogenase